MYPHELLGKYGIRKKPVKIVLENAKMSNHGNADFQREIFDYSFTTTPILILASTDSHIVYFDPEDMERSIIGELLGSMEDTCDCDECKEFSKDENDDGKMGIMPKILNSNYIDNEWQDFSSLLELAGKSDIMRDIFNELNTKEE